MGRHESVLKNETIDLLNIIETGTYVDCTLGRAGHTLEIAKHLHETGTIIGIDQDKEAIQSAEMVLKQFNPILIHTNFRHVTQALNKHNIKEVDGFLFDLGVSSPQLDQGERGFSYRYDAYLDMRMDQTQPLTAYNIVNDWDYNDLVHIFFSYGEERFSRQIARTIERERVKKKIETTFELVELIKASIPAAARRRGGHPAKRTFQALRIAVNDELSAFNDALHQAAKMVKIGGRIVVITFHSLEDRMCKLAFNKWSREKPVPRGLPIVPDHFKAPFKRITTKPIVPTEQEIRNNRRARSAKLRVVEKVRTWNEEFTYEEGWKKR